MPIFRCWKDPGLFQRGFPNVWTEGSLVAGCEWVDEVVIGDSFFEGWLFADSLKRVNLQSFISSTNSALGNVNAENLLDAYQISPSTHPNTFWNQLLLLTGDMMFSHLTHSLSHNLAKSNKKLYRYHQTIRNPFPGSNMYQIPGHHFIELLYLFGTLKERYPNQRLKDISEEYGKKWLMFAVGQKPWAEYDIEEEKIMIISGGEGFDLRTRKEDELKSATADEGERRYKAWEVIDDIMADLGSENGEEIRMGWGPDGGFWRLAGLEGPYGVVLP